MSRSDIEQVLRNWIDEATSSRGKLAQGIDPAAWVADNFIAWWRQRTEDSLRDAEEAAGRLRDELGRHGTPAELGAALHELTHVQDSLGDLRGTLGLFDSPAQGT